MEIAIICVTTCMQPFTFLRAFDLAATRNHGSQIVTITSTTSTLWGLGNDVTT